jgi:prephenate dehydrogenase
MIQKKYLIVGCGLIGGSIARKLRIIDQDCIIDYFDRNEIKSGFLTKYDYRKVEFGDSEIYYDCVFFTVNIFPKTFKAKVFVTLFSFAEKLDQGRGNYIPEIGVHFMAGSEKSGFENSSATLFDGCNFSVIQYESDEKHKEILSEIEPLIKQIANSSEPILSVSPEEHNINVAYTSHFLHFLALKIPQFSEFPCLKRISQSNQVMWEEIFKKNEKNIMYAFGRFLSNIFVYGLSSSPTAFATTIRRFDNNIKENFKGTAYYEVVGNLDKN